MQFKSYLAIDGCKIKYERNTDIMVNVVSLNQKLQNYAQYSRTEKVSGAKLNIGFQKQQTSPRYEKLSITFES